MDARQQFTPGNELAESLKGLQSAVHLLKTETALSVASIEARFPNLLSAIKKLDTTKAAKPISDPREYSRLWDDVLAGRRRDLEPHVIRSLCWNPSVATDERFQNFLNEARYLPNAQALQGMICSCHARWSREFAQSESVSVIRSRLERYPGRNRLLLRWKEASPMILGPKAHDFMALTLIKSDLDVSGFCDFWGFSIESSKLFQAAAEVASVMCLEQIDLVPQYQEFLFKELMPWSGWEPKMLKNVMSRLILFPTRDKTSLIDQIVQLVRSDSRFGDPRHPQNHNNWIGMDEAAKRVQEWLSAADITFFFETVLPKGKDPHGRKEFWMRYVGRKGLRSRPLLSTTDKYRLRDVLAQRGAKPSDFGRLLDDDTSAFILDFGLLMAIEFSAVGNACFIYEKQIATKIVPDIWTTVPFSKAELKRPSKVATQSRAGTPQPIRHDRQNRWKIELERFLAIYGIRAVS